MMIVIQRRKGNGQNLDLCLSVLPVRNLVCDFFLCFKISVTLLWLGNCNLTFFFLHMFAERSYKKSKKHKKKSKKRRHKSVSATSFFWASLRDNLTPYSFSNPFLGIWSPAVFTVSILWDQTGCWYNSNFVTYMLILNHLRPPKSWGGGGVTATNQGNMKDLLVAC